jgi:hypothetical protein
MMKKTILTLVILSVMALTKSYSQNYKSGLGLRLGRPMGITGKMFLNDKGALEGILHTWRDAGFGITGLYEIHSRLGRDRNLQFYYGPGAGIAVHNNDFSLGINLVVGIEYKIKTAPITVGLDVKPYINVIPAVEFSENYVDAALSLRYTF